MPPRACAREQLRQRTHERLDPLDQFRVEPAAVAQPDFVERGLSTAGGVKDIDDLRQQRDPRVQRDVLAGQALRPAVAVEVLVEAVDAGRHLVRKTQQAGDLGAALAARLDQFGGQVLTVADDIQHAAEALG